MITHDFLLLHFLYHSGCKKFSAVYLYNCYHTFIKKKKGEREYLARVQMFILQLVRYKLN